MQGRMELRRWRRLSVALGAALLVLPAAAGSASAATSLTPGAVFTQTNTVPNTVLAFNRGADGRLTQLQQVFPTGGNGRPAGNPPFFTAFPVLDSMGSVNLGDDGDNKPCLFVVNAGSNTVSSFRVGPKGLELADQKPSGGSRPASVTSTTRGPSKLVAYVLNSDNESASIQGFYVSGSCGLSAIPGSHRDLPSQSGVPATVRFNEQGDFLAVSERYAPSAAPPPGGNGDIVVYPVDSKGFTGAPVVTPSLERTPYGLDYNHQGILSVTNEHIPTFDSTVSTYRQADDGSLEPLDTEPSPGAACWNLFTSNGKFLFVTNPAGQLVGGANVVAFTVDRGGNMTRVDQENTPFEAIDNALSHDDRYLYVLSGNVVSEGTASAITSFAIDKSSGELTQIDNDPSGTNSTSGLAAW